MSSSTSVIPGSKSEWDEHKGIEIERKFLVKKMPDLSSVPHKEIKRGYLRIGSDGSETRVSQTGNDFTLTTKVGREPVNGRLEDNHRISYDAFTREIWKARKKTVAKERYYIPYTDPKSGKDHTIELDMFKGKLLGLVMAEVEFKTCEDRDGFTPPAWFGAEVTSDRRYYGQRLAVEGLPQDRKLTALLREERRRNRKVLPLNEGIAAAVDIIGEKRAALDVDDRATPILIGIAGKTSSGKTSEVAAKLNHLLCNDIVILSMDNWYKPKQKELDSPKAFNLALLADTLRALRAGERVEIPSHDFDTQLTTFKGTVVAPKRFIAVEGLFTLTDELKNMFDVKIFVDTELYGQLIRRVLRDRVQRAAFFTPQQNIRYFLETVVPYQEKFLTPTKEAADVVISNNYNPFIEAKAAGGFEVQEKFATAVSAEQIERLGATKANTAKQVDEYYFPDENWRSNLGEGIMVRTEGRDTTFVYKGPNTGSNPRRQARYEVPIDQPIRELMSAVFRGPSVKISKERAEYTFDLESMTLAPGKVTLVMDTDVKRTISGKTENLGSFVELKYDSGLEGAEENAKVLAASLGLRDGTPSPYILL
jgi:uridine kinase/CYTH domain-containing protein